MSESSSLDLEPTLKAFKGHLQYYGNEKEQRAESTANSYASEVRMFAEYLEEEREYTDGLLDVTKSDLRRYLQHCREKGDKDRTVIGRRSAISQFYQALQILAEDREISVSEDAIPVNPEDGFGENWAIGESHKSKEEGEKAYLVPEQVKKLYRNVPAPEFRNTLILKLLYQTGMRRKELATLRLDDVLPLENQSITIRAKNAKSGKSRPVYYKENLIPELRRWIDGGYRDAEGYAEESEYLLPTRERIHIHPNHVTQIVKRAAENAGLQANVYTDSGGKDRDRVTPHTMRHSFAVSMLTPPNAIDVRTLQGILGHSDLSVTEEYLKIARDDEKNEYLRSGGPPE